MPPRLELSPAVVDFGRLRRHSQSPERRVRLGNAGGGSLNARAASSASWLKLRQVGDELVVGVDTTAVGEHEGTVTVDSDGGTATIRVQARVDPTRRSAPRTAAAQPGAVPETAKGARPGPQQDAARPETAPAPAATPPPPTAEATPATSAGGVIMGPDAEPILPAADVHQRAAPQARADRLLRVAGLLAIAAAALLVASLRPTYIWEYALYVLVLAILALTAGASTLIPRTRRLTGPGLLVGIAAASTWGLLFCPIDGLRSETITSDGGWPFKFFAHLVLVIAACVAGLALARTAGVHLKPRLPQSGLTWLVVLLGGAGAVALFFHDLDLWGYFGSLDRFYIAPSIWATVMALVVPACAVVAVPRQFAVALLAGWIAGGAVLFGANYLWDRYRDSGSGSKPIITFGVTLLGLLVVTVLFARAAPSPEAERG